jgi:hypothetical protein
MKTFAINLMRNKLKQFHWNRTAPTPLSNLRWFVEETDNLDGPEVAKMCGFVGRFRDTSGTASIPVDVPTLRDLLEEVDRLMPKSSAA